MQLRLCVCADWAVLEKLVKQILSLQSIDGTVEFEAQKKNHAVEPDVDHQNQQGSDRTVKFVVFGETNDVDSEDKGRQYNQYGGKNRADTEERIASCLFCPEFEKYGSGDQNHQANEDESSPADQVDGLKDALVFELLDKVFEYYY